MFTLHAQYNIISPHLELSSILFMPILKHGCLQHRDLFEAGLFNMQQAQWMTTYHTSHLNLHVQYV